jgi:hypothetical protein
VEETEGGECEEGEIGDRKESEEEEEEEEEEKEERKGEEEEKKRKCEIFENLIITKAQEIKKIILLHYHIYFLCPLSVAILFFFLCVFFPFFVYSLTTPVHLLSHFPLSVQRKKERKKERRV